MDDTSKYLIHAAITADGIVERSDVVGAIFGQTEGLLGDELDLRDLQQASKVGRIDVEIESEAGQSFGHVTIATSLDRVETSILAASLETITRVGPCRSEVRVTDIEDVREAKRREVVERAKELLAESFSESIMTSTEILNEVRESVRVEDITEYEGLPAGPNVVDSDAIVVVEGRSDVITLLKYGIKNAIAVEGTNIPDAVADLTQHRTVTAFLDGDRGGELILRELVQVGNVDYVAFAPDGQSVEDLDRSTAMSALRDKVPYETFAMGDEMDGTDESAVDDVASDDEPTEDGETRPAAEGEQKTGVNDRRATGSSTETDDGSSATVAETDGAGAVVASADDTTASAVAPDRLGDSRGADREDSADVAETETSDTPAEVDDDAAAERLSEADTDTTEEDTTEKADEDVGTLRGVARDIIEAETGTACLTDDAFRAVTSGPAEEAFELLKDAEETPYAVFVDGEVTQRLLDVAAQRGTEHVIGRSLGEFVKRPVSVRIRTAEQLLGPRAAGE